MSLSLPSTDVGWVAPADRLATLPEGMPELTLGEEAAAWCRAWLIQPNGPRAGKPFHPTFDQYRFLLWWYAIDREGRWLFHHGARRLAKGSGKSPFAAVLALIEFCAPVRLDRFDDRVEGGCRGKPVDMPLVQIAATAESQTANTMRMVRAFAPKGSKVVEEYRLDPGKTRYYKLPEGTLEIITSSATAAEGAESSFIVADETEHWRPSNGGEDLAATLHDNLAKSGARLLETSNAWVPGVQTVAELTWDAWVAQEEGKAKAETRILYDARIAPANTDIYDVTSLRPALESVYDDCTWKYGPDGKPDVRSILNRITTLTSKVDDSKRKYLNWPSASSEAWVLPEQWLQMSRPDIVVGRDDEIVLFLDPSESRDATALVGCRVSDGHIFTLGTWEPDTAHDTEEAVDVNDVDRVVIHTFEVFTNIPAFFADVHPLESFVKGEWPRRYGDRLKLWAAPSRKPPQVIGWDMRSHQYEFALAAETVHAEIEEGAFTHDGNPVTTRHIVNCHRHPYKGLVSVSKGGNSSKKIDAAVCVIGARMVRQLALSGIKRPNSFVPRRIR